MSESTELLSAIHEIRDLVRLMAEPQIAASDEKMRQQLIGAVGKSQAKARAALLMDGSHTQAAIHSETKINKGHLSTFVKQLGEAKLLSGDAKRPKLAIPIPSDFLEKTRGDE